MFINIWAIQPWSAAFRVWVPDQFKVSYNIYAILCVKFVRKVRYFTSKVAIISLSALVVRKVTSSEIIVCSVRKAMRKVSGDARRAARGWRKSGEERGVVTKEVRAARVEPVHENQRQYKQNKQSSKHQTKFVFLTIIVFIRLWHWKRRFSWPVGQWKSEGMLGRILNVEKKSEEKRCKNRKKNLTWAPVIVWKRKKPFPFPSSVECSHKMEMKYSDRGTLVQRQRYPLPSRSLQYWPMNHCVRNPTSRRSVFENIFDNCFVIIGNGEFNYYHFNNCTSNFKGPQ